MILKTWNSAMAGSRRRKHHDRARENVPSTSASPGAQGFVFSNSPVISTNFTESTSALAPSGVAAPIHPIATAALTILPQGQTVAAFLSGPQATTPDPSQLPQMIVQVGAITYTPPPTVTTPSGLKSVSILRPAPGPWFSFYIEPSSYSFSYVSDADSYSGPESNHVYYVPVPPKPNQETSLPPPRIMMNQESIPVSLFHSFPHLPASPELLARYERARHKLTESIKNDQLKQRAEEENRSNLSHKSGVRSYETPNAEAYERIVENHVARLQEHFRAKLWQTCTQEATNALLTGGDRSGKPQFVLCGLEKLAIVDPDARQRVLRHRSLVSSMDERMVRDAKVLMGQEFRPNETRLRRKTSWAQLDKSVLKELLEKRAKSETQSQSATPATGSPDSEHTTDTSRNRFKAGVILNSGIYYCKPSLSQLDELTDQNTGSCRVRNFEVGHQIYGKIVFSDEINVVGLHLDKIVKFSLGKVQLYCGDQSLPPFGRELHRPFIATLYNIYPHLKNCQRDEPPGAGGRLLKQESMKAAEMIEKYKRVLQQSCARFGGEFLGYDYNTATWTFKILRLDSN